MRITLTKEQKEELTALLNIQWNNDPGMLKHCLTNTYYIALGEGVYLSVGSKQSIDKTMYYDDETTGPENNKENWIAYNKRRSPEHYDLTRIHGYNEPRTLVMQPQYFGNKTDSKLLGLTYDPRGEFLPLAQTVSPELLKRINEEVDNINADFDKRLETYWKRFSNKVRTQGYWANRQYMVIKAKNLSTNAVFEIGSAEAMILYGLTPSALLLLLNGQIIESEGYRFKEVE